ncbi:MAG: hypothetical protein R2729_21730 [Bryobacteraceae bacterium]
MSMTLKELMPITPDGEEPARESRQEGHQEGHREGRIEEARRDVLFVARSRFPGLLDEAMLDRAAGLQAVRGLFEALILAQDCGQAESAIARWLDLADR